MEGLYDMHCHLIPGVDDGSKDMEESIAALRLMAGEGVEHIFCTSHYSAECKDGYAQEVKEAFEKLKEQTEAEGMGDKLSLHLGNELMYTESLVEQLKQGNAWTMAGSHYVLVEFFPSVRYEELYGGLRRLASAGYLPILAHMERYACLTKLEDRLEELEDLAVYLQVNGASLFGGLFDKGHSYVRKLCKAGKIHFLGTDSHGTHYRKPDIKRAAEWVADNCTEHIARAMLYENPKAVLDDKIL